MPPIKKYLIGGVGVLAGAAILFLFAMIATDPADNVSLLRTEAGTGVGGERFIAGAIEMTQAAQAQLEFDLFGEDGTVVGVAEASVTNIASGVVWEFEAPVLVPEAVRYRVRSLTCRPTLVSSDWEIRRTCYLPPRDRPPFSGALPPPSR